VGRRRAAPELIAREGDLVVLRDRERPSGRLLRQDDMDASYVDLEDPKRLGFEYLRRMRDVVEVAGARRVVHVGGAGCALARALAAAHPDHRQEVLEVDPAVVEMARRHLGLRRAPGLRVRVGEGRAVLSRRDAGSADAVLIDAFVGARVPRSVVTVEALATFARVVAPAGRRRAPAGRQPRARRGAPRDPAAAAADPRGRRSRAGRAARPGGDRGVLRGHAAVPGLAGKRAGESARTPGRTCGTAIALAARCPAPPPAAW